MVQTGAVECTAGGGVEHRLPAFMHEILTAVSHSVALEPALHCNHTAHVFSSYPASLVPLIVSLVSPSRASLLALSFGVVMLELLTGRSNIIDNEVKPVHIKEWVSHTCPPS